jgi:hypothetical protein
MADDDAALGEQILQVTEAEVGPALQPGGVGDHPTPSDPVSAVLSR